MTWRSAKAAIAEKAIERLVQSAISVGSLSVGILFGPVGLVSLGGLVDVAAMNRLFLYLVLVATVSAVVSPKPKDTAAARHVVAEDRAELERVQGILAELDDKVSGRARDFKRSPLVLVVHGHSS